jgi:hypothetical protein
VRGREEDVEVIQFLAAAATGVLGSVARGGGATHSVLHQQLFVSADWRKKKATLGWLGQKANGPKIIVAKMKKKRVGWGLFGVKQRDQQERNRNPFSEILS